MSPAARLPRWLWWLAALYCAASFIHFAHNAQNLPAYPNMPAWLSPGRVYAAWGATAVVGLAALLAARAGWRTTALLLLAAYGALGLYGLAHYALAPRAMHTLAMNSTIWGEAITGAMLALGSLATMAKGRRGMA